MSVINKLLPNRRSLAKVENTVKNALASYSAEAKPINKKDVLNAVVKMMCEVNLSQITNNAEAPILTIDYNLLEILKLRLKENFASDGLRSSSSSVNSDSSAVEKIVELLLELKQHDSIVGVFFQANYPRTFVKALYSLFIMDIKANLMHTTLANSSINALHNRFMAWIKEDIGLDPAKINLDYIVDSRLQRGDKDFIPGFLPTLDYTIISLSFTHNSYNLNFNFKHNANSVLPLYGYEDKFEEGPDFSHLVNPKTHQHQKITDDVGSGILEVGEAENDVSSACLKDNGKAKDNFNAQSNEEITPSNPYSFNLGNTKLEVEEHIDFSKGNGQFIRMSGKPSDYPKQLIKCKEVAIGDTSGDTFSMLCQLVETGVISYSTNENTSKSAWEDLKQICNTFHDISIALLAEEPDTLRAGTLNQEFTLNQIESSNLPEEAKTFFQKVNRDFIAKLVNHDQVITINSFKKLLLKKFIENLTIFNVNPDIRVIWIGDLFKDYYYNDALTLEFFNFLQANNCNYEIILSNHDLSFIDRVKGMPREQFDEKFQREYLENNLCFAKNEIDACLKKLERCYFNKLRACAKSYDNVTLYTHGIINSNHLSKLSTATDYVSDINTQLKKLIDNYAEVGHRTISEPSSPWNPLANEIELYMVQDGKPQLPHGIEKLVHGHTEEYLHKMLQLYHEQITKPVENYKIDLTIDLQEAFKVITELATLSRKGIYNDELRVFSYFYPEARLVKLKQLLETILAAIPNKEQLKKGAKSDRQIEIADGQRYILRSCILKVENAIKNPTSYLSLNYNLSCRNNDEYGIEYSTRNQALYYLPA
jgi:hypothetical protein